jgi:L-asparaginase
MDEAMTLAGKTVAVFSLGGTIAMTTDPVSGGVIPALSAHDLLGAVPGLESSGVTLQVVDFRRLPGASLGFADLTDLAGAIKTALAGGTDGVVVTQGTDTIEETAFFLDLRHQGEQPVVVTGAMRNPTMPGADGPANLYAAVIAAASEELRGAGTVVVLGDEVHAARRVRKSHTTSPAAFTSPTSGPIARIIENRVRLTGSLPARRPASVSGSPGRPARIGLHTVTFGDDAKTLSLLDGHLDGLIVAAFGVGHVPEELVAVLEHLAASMPVVLASRIGNGPVLTGTYSFPGSEKDLLSRGLISAADLDPYKARLLLHLLISHGADRDTIRVAFDSMSG